MLQNIRDNLTGKTALIVLAVIALSFVFVGGASFTTLGSNYAAKVDGVDIGIAQFESVYREQLQANPQLATLPPESRKLYRTNILEQLIQQRVVDNYINEAGFEVSDEQLTKVVHRIPDFQVDGRFDRDTYESVLALNASTPARFEIMQKLTMRRMQLQRAILGTSIVSPSNYRRYLNLAFEGRLVTAATIGAEAVADEIIISDEMISAFYDENPVMFNLPETADVEYVEIRRNEVAANVSVSEEDLQEYYEVNRSRYQQDEQRQARHILILFDDDEVGSEAVANEVLTRIRSGDSFVELARQYSMDSGNADNGGYMGALTRDQMPDALGGVVFSMRQGDIQGPVKGDFGFHIVQLDEILESGPLPFAQVRPSLLTELQEEQAEGLFLKMQRKLSAALFEATEISDIGELAAAVGGKVQMVARFSRDSVEPFDAIPAAVEAIFDAEVLSGSQISNVTELDANRTAVFTVTQHNEATREPMQAVREQILAALSNSQSEKLMSTRAQQMLDAINGGEEFATAAAAIGAERSDPVLMTRNAEGMDQNLAVAIFTSVKPTKDAPILGSTRNHLGGYTVFSLDAVVPGSPQGIPQADRDAGKIQLLEQYGVGDFVAMVHALRANAEVIINEDALAAQDLFQ
jgi:peptidyl-prolyl cis-trans isomerase D